MRPRWQVAFLILTMPIWFVPALIACGWREGGRDEFMHLPQSAAYAFFGRIPKRY